MWVVMVFSIVLFVVWLCRLLIGLNLFRLLNSSVMLCFDDIGVVSSVCRCLLKFVWFSRLVSGLVLI